MALISASLKEAPKSAHSARDTTTACPTQSTGTDEMTDLSSQDTTLRELQVQVRRDQTQGSSKQKRRNKKRRPSKRGVPMREEIFAKIGWTRSFIFGPADPVHNPHMVWCHMCKKKFSIRTNGPFESLRHHRSEKHLRRDQWWMYEHLKSVDPVGGRVQHRVCGRNGKVLTKIEAAKELPNFIHLELVDIGEKYSFYDDFIQGRATALVTPESLARTQFSIVGDFLKTQRDFSVLRGSWARISSFTDHQASLSDFDWEKHISVCFIL